MGGAKAYKPEGGFSKYEFRQDGETITVGGVSAKVIVKLGDDEHQSGLPIHSNTPDSVYINVLGKGKEPVQLRVFQGRTASKDFDWNHEHKDKATGKVYPKGVVHVQVFDENGVRDGKHARYMNNAEMKQYGPMIKFLFPGVKFRP